MIVERFYIKKPNGKYRPIGAPNLVSKMIGKAFADMMKHAGGAELEKQHGFHPGRGISTAIYAIWKNLEAGRTEVYEFDLKSWFNKVRPV